MTMKQILRFLGILGKYFKLCIHEHDW